MQRLGGYCPALPGVAWPRRTLILRTYLDFEKSVAEIENKIEELQALAEASGADAISQGQELSPPEDQGRKPARDDLFQA